MFSCCSWCSSFYRTITDLHISSFIGFNWKIRIYVTDVIAAFMSLWHKRITISLGDSTSGTSSWFSSWFITSFRCQKVHISKYFKVFLANEQLHFFLNVGLNWTWRPCSHKSIKSVKHNKYVRHRYFFSPMTPTQDWHKSDQVMNVSNLTKYTLTWKH